MVSVLGGKLIKENVPFTGFGGTAFGNLYQVTLEIGDLVFPNIHIIANSELNTSYNLILSATMFERLIYEIDTKTHRLNVSVPDGEIWLGISESLIVRAAYILCAINNNNLHPYITVQAAINSK